MDRERALMISKNPKRFDIRSVAEAAAYLALTASNVTQPPQDEFTQRVPAPVTGIDPSTGKNRAVEACPICRTTAVQTAHGPYCPNTECKWGWEVEMDGSLLKPLQPLKPALHPSPYKQIEPGFYEIKTPISTFGFKEGIDYVRVNPPAFNGAPTTPDELSNLIEAVEFLAKKGFAFRSCYGWANAISTATELGWTPYCPWTLGIK